MIRPKFTKQDIRKAFTERLFIIDKAIVSRFIYVGETFVNNARKNGTYQDQTGNLRSSICYIVYKDGVKRSAAPIPEESKKLVNELKYAFNKGYVLIVVAGMNYAAAVESKGKDVLTGSLSTAKKQLREAFKSFKA